MLYLINSKEVRGQSILKIELTAKQLRAQERESIERLSVSLVIDSKQT